MFAIISFPKQNNNNKSNKQKAKNKRPEPEPETQNPASRPIESHKHSGLTRY